MVIVLKQGYAKKPYDELTAYLKNFSIEIQVNVGTDSTVLGIKGDTAHIDIDRVESNVAVESVKRIQEPYKAANRKFHPNDTIVSVANVKIGGGNFINIAGPCSVESEEQIIEIAKRVKNAGANMLRGGAFKPRTSPYAFQGLRAEGIELLLLAKKETGLPIVTEIMDISHLPLFENIDIIQVGARNMQNFELLKELGRQKKPVLLKRGLMNTLQEFLMSAEYIMAGGNGNIILCERGIRTFETTTRNTLDLASIPVLKRMTHLPIIVDPSHATGIASLVTPTALAATVIGADGLIIEVHNDPEHALCDGPQSITPDEYDSLIKRVNGLIPVAYKG